LPIVIKKHRKRNLREDCITTKVRKRDCDFVLLKEVVIFGAHRKKKKIIWVARVALLSEKRIEFKVFLRKSEGKMSEGLRSRLKGKVYMDI
jgi:hypothetical protein